MRRDITSLLHPVPLFLPKAAGTDNTAMVSKIIDTKGYNACMLAIVTGALTDADATFTVLVEDGNVVDSEANPTTLTDHAAVDDKYLNGTEALAGFKYDDDNKCRKIGYVGPKRFVRVTITPASNDSGNIFVAGVAVLGEPTIAPTPNPPQ
ncbi:conserved hypothetical protein [Hyphomicrobium denitrificans ATCC 51888]|uniref:Uncharacterized protein n=1 Tax=Hyphomicrobium denitrificans (strain ATCC 51888 / DSM 1869 / NCIMB 11706 / TK 0415) TaxID=582899 RepID=D8JVB8_HYPDA|nr:hypothetical protein [Hyphomicrobium denitrificans]ADJ24772.1 conserved hypothetical protein [Hyphomicrobium denitrificans ATCC 51888]